MRTKVDGTFQPDVVRLRAALEDHVEVEGDVLRGLESD
jgi:hypothetical protein